MRKRVMIFIAIFFLTGILTGCWSRNELNELAFVVGQGFDKKGDQVQVTVQIVNPREIASKKGGGGYTTPVSTFQATEDTISEAMRKIMTICPRKLYGSHLQILVIGEKLAKDGISNVLDYISRNHEMRSDFYIAVAKDTSADKILKVLTPIDKIPANQLFSTLELSEKIWAPTVKVTLDELLSDLESEGKGPVLTGIQIKGSEQGLDKKANVSQSDPYSQLQYSGLAVFKDDKLVGWLNDKESKGYNYILGNVTNTIGSIDCPNGGKLAIEVIRTKANVRAKVENRKPSIHIELNLEENIAEVKCKIDLTDPESIKQLENISNEKLEEIMNAGIQKAKQYKVDIFGFGEAIYRSDPTYWKQNKENWDQQFVKLPVTVNAKFKIRSLGTLNNSMIEKPKE